MFPDFFISLPKSKDLSPKPINMRKLFVISLLVIASSAMAQRTPTMGWSSWNTFALNINEDLIKQQADAMHQTGLQKAGFKYVNIDDGYWDGRGEDGHLRLNMKLFPSGLSWSH